MNVALEDCVVARKDVPMRELIAHLQQTLARNHQKILDAARSDWERRSSIGQDPSDACVSLRIGPPVQRLRKAPAQDPGTSRRRRTVNGAARRNHRSGD